MFEHDLPMIIVSIFAHSLNVYALIVSSESGKHMKVFVFNRPNALLSIVLSFDSFSKVISVIDEP